MNLTLIEFELLERLQPVDGLRFTSGGVDLAAVAMVDQAPPSSHPELTVIDNILTGSSMKKLATKTVVGITLLGVGTAIVPIAWLIEVLNGKSSVFTLVPLILVPTVGFVLVLFGILLLTQRVLVAIAVLTLYILVVILSFFCGIFLCLMFHDLDLTQ